MNLQVLFLIAVSEVLVFLKDTDSRKPITNRVKNESIIRENGDYMIGGLFPAHANYNRTNNNCTDEYNLSGMIYIQAVMYAIKELANPQLPIGSKLGYVIVDDCYGTDLAMEASVKFLMGDDVDARREWIKKYKKNRPNFSSERIQSPVLAVVGAANSDISAAVASLLSVNSIPQISYSATSPELSDKTRYPSFMRTIPPDSAQVAAMADVVQYFNWTWIAVVATDDSYGRFALQGLKDVLHKKGICLAAEELIDASVSAESVNRALDHLESSPVIKRAQVVVARNFSGKTWIASESWGFRSFNAETYQHVLKGALGLHVNTADPKKFINYFVYQLKFCDANKWLQNYLNDAPKLPNGTKWSRNSTKRLATHPGWLLREGGILTDGSNTLFAETPQVIDAILAITTSLKQLVKQKFKVKITGYQLLENLYKLRFRNSVKVLKKFNRNGEIGGGYVITNLKKRKNHTEALAQKGTLAFIPVGMWNGSGWTQDSILDPDPDGERLSINASKIIWPKGAGKVPTSSCHHECQPGTYKIYATKRCCWTCARCPEDTYTDEIGLILCKNCPSGMESNSEHTGCTFIETYIDWKSPGELVVLSMAALGFVCVGLVTVIFVNYRRTPVVVCSNAPLTFTLLVLLAGGFVLPFLFALRPSPALCSAESVLFGLVFSTITAIFLVKTRHVLQIFTAKLADSLYLVNQRGIQRREIWQSAAFAAVALSIAVSYLVASPPHPVAHQADCGAQWTILQIVNMVYIAILSVAATYVAFRARNLPENYNEANNIRDSFKNDVISY